MHSKRSTRRGRFCRRLAVVAAAAVLATLAPSPAGAQTFPYQTWPWSSTGFTPGTSPGILLVGDSLIDYVGSGGSQPVSDHIKTVTGRSTFVNATPGASWMNYGWPGEQANGAALMQDFADLLNPRLSIGALATNDAILLTNHPTIYTPQIQYNIMANTVNVTRQHSYCVMLVNVRRRNVTGTMTAAAALQVNNNMNQLAAASSRVFVANWDAFAAGQSGIFLPNNVHMTEAGELVYAAFISGQAQNLINNHNC